MTAYQDKISEGPDTGFSKSCFPDVDMTGRQLIKTKFLKVRVQASVKAALQTLI